MHELSYSLRGPGPLLQVAEAVFLEAKDPKKQRVERNACKRDTTRICCMHMFQEEVRKCSEVNT